MLFMHWNAHNQNPCLVQVPGCIGEQEHHDHSALPSSDAVQQRRVVSSAQQCHATCCGIPGWIQQPGPRRRCSQLAAMQHAASRSVAASAHLRLARITRTAAATPTPSCRMPSYTCIVAHGPHVAQPAQSLGSSMAAGAASAAQAVLRSLIDTTRS